TLTGTGTGTVTSTTTYSPQTQFNCTRSNPGPSNSGTCGPIAFTNNSTVITFSVSATGGSTIGAWTLGDPSWITVSGCASGNSSSVVNINNNAGTMSVAFNAAPTPTKLAFGVQPTNTDKDAAITPAVTVRILDSSNNLVTSSTRNVTLAIGTNPSGGTLAGTATVAAVGGIATFSNLSINNAGNGYTLIASSGSPTPALTTATSTPFNINKVNQTTLTVNAPATLTYGSTATLTATGGSGTGALSYSAGTSTGCSVAGDQLSVTNASGTCSVTASKAADDNYNVANSAAAVVTLLKKDATWTTIAASKTYGDLDPVPLTTGSGNGFLMSDGVSATYARTSGESASPPTYPITATLTATVAGD